MTTKETTTWIDALDRLPDASGEYIIYAESIVNPGEYWMGTSGYIPNAGWDVYFSRILYWMPLPEPPNWVK